MAPEGRDSHRSASCVKATCHVGGRRRRARVIAVSEVGCGAELACRGTAPGDRVVLELTGLLAIPATVVWVHEGRAGLEFASPMMAAMLRQFLLRQGRRDRLH